MAVYEDLSGKVAIGSRGIGRVIVERLGREGASVVVNYAGSAARKAVSAVEESGGKAVAVQADTSQVEEVRRLFQETENRFGRPYHTTQMS